MTPGTRGGLLVRLQASARFRDAARRSILTRPFARRRASLLFDLCAGFVYSQILAAFVALDLPERLRAVSDAAALAPALGLTEDRTERLLAAAAALGLAARHGGRYGLGPLGAALIDNQGVAAMIAHHDRLYDDLRDPVALLRRQGAASLGAYWPYAAAGVVGADEAVPYSALMNASQAMVASEALDAYDVSGHRRLLDVGGGWGAFLRAAAERAPSLRLALFDLPAVAQAARARVPARVACVGGDFRTDPIPAGADLITLVRVLHDHDHETAMALLRSIRRALAPGGRLLIAEPMAGTPGAKAAGDGYFGFYLLAMGSGRPRTPRRLREMLRASGFAHARLLPTRMPLIARALLAR